MMEILKSSQEKSGSPDFTLDWFKLFPWEITSKDFEEILTYYIDERMKDAKRVSTKARSSRRK